MPHVSKKKLSEQMSRELEKQIVSLIRDSGSKTRLEVFNELLTDTERLMLAKRLGIIVLAKKGLSLYKIAEVLGISPSTAERFEMAIESKKYRRTIEWVWKNSKDGKFEKFLTSFIRLAFTRRTQSFNKFVEEM